MSAVAQIIAAVSFACIMLVLCLLVFTNGNDFSTLDSSESITESESETEPESESRVPAWFITESSSGHERTSVPEWFIKKYPELVILDPDGTYRIRTAEDDETAETSDGSDDTSEEDTSEEDTDEADTDEEEYTDWEEPSDWEDDTTDWEEPTWHEEPTDPPTTTTKATEATGSLPISSDNIYGLTEDEIYHMARVVYYEEAIESRSSDRSIYLCACVMLNRMLDWGYSNMHDVLNAPGQYATGSWSLPIEYVNSRAWAGVRQALDDLDRNPHYQANGSWLDSMNLELYYRDPVTNEVFYY